MAKHEIELAPGQLQEAQAAAEKQLRGLAEGLHAKAEELVFEALEQHKAQHGFEHLDEAMVAHALVALVKFLDGNKMLLKRPETEIFVNVALNAIPGAAIAAKARAENKRVIVLGG